MKDEVKCYIIDESVPLWESRKGYTNLNYQMKDKNISRIIGYLLFAGWLLFNGILLVLHEPWRDEANVWLIAKELSPTELFREIKYQGHPCLWYLMVMPIAKIGFPFRMIEVLSLSVMSVTAWTFLWKAPFRILTKAVCLFSPIFTYFYSDIARNYCLIALILVILAWQFPERNNHSVRYGLLLGLLVQTDIIAIAPAGMISAMWFLENIWQCCRERSGRRLKKVLMGIWIPAVSVGLLFLQFYQVSDSPQFQVRELEIKEFIREIRNFTYGILIRMTGRGQSFCLLFFVLCFLVFLVAALRVKNGWAGIALGCSVLFQAAFSAVIYQLHLWHYISLGFVFIWAVWVMREQWNDRGGEDKIGRAGLMGLEILLMLLSVCMFLHWNSKEESSNLEQALHGLYSDGGNAAKYIRKQIDSDELIISDNVPMASTVLAYLKNYEFYYAGSGRQASYADWSEDQSGKISYQELLMWVRESFPDKKSFYVLKSNDSCIYDEKAFKNCVLLYQSGTKTTRGEEYRIYRIEIQGEQK